MESIRLSGGHWRFDASKRLGPAGGFGQVFVGEGPDGAVAVKRLNMTAGQAAHREMSIGQRLSSERLSYVVPILDYGQDSESDRYFIVMPICDCSLQDKIGEAHSLEYAKPILLNIAAGLLEVGDIVHRDLKPGNILLHDGVWKIADFGIAKFVEDSTSLDTLRGSLTPSYGAPEQWRGERPSKETDVYALGCIACALLDGHPPFTGDANDVREGHLHRSPKLNLAPPMLRAIVSQMLRKAPDARPSLDRFVKVLENVGTSLSGGPRSELAKAADKIAHERSVAEAAEAERRSQEERWVALGSEARNEYEDIRNSIYNEVLHASNDAVRHSNGIEWGSSKIIFGDLSVTRFIHRNDIPSDAQWEAVAWATAELHCQQSRSAHSRDAEYIYGTTIFFGKRRTDISYRWHEVSFWAMGGLHNAPFGLPLNTREAKIALSRTMGTVNVALGPLPIDAEDEENFQNRWLSLIAKAATGNLIRPNQMPPPDSFYH